MEITQFKIEGPLLIKNNCFGDERGFFTERYKKNEFEKLGLPEFIQDNFSVSSPGILRGLHYQWDLPQGKLVTCTSGKIRDVIVDIRAKSKTFGEHISVELDSNQPTWFWVPAGFAHGFLVLGTEKASVLYKVNNYWNSKGEGAILWNDQDLSIDWGIEKPELSAKDAVAQKFSDYELSPKF